MARKTRIEYPGAFYHIIAKGNNFEIIFRDDQDFLTYLDRLSLYLKKGDLTLYAYCLMPEHVHLLISRGNLPLSKSMKCLHTFYAGYYNRKYHRVGHLFQGRYKGILFDPDAYLLELVRHIHLNPIRAGIVKSPEEYRWSSHPIYLRKRKDNLVNTSFVLRYFSLSPSKAIRRFRQFVNNNEGTFEGKRDDLYKLVDQRILGDQDFVKEVLNKAKENRIESILKRLFGSKTRVKIFSLFIKNRDKAFYQRKIMHLTKGNLNAIQKELSNLTKIGLLLRSDGKARVYYRLNNKSPLLRPILSLFNSFLKKIESQNPG